jgi:hypothetical protein
MSTTRRAVPAPAEPFVRELVPLAGRLHLVLTHMEAHREAGEPPPDAPAVAEVLAGLLLDVLAPLGRRRGADLAVAAAVLREAGEAIERDLFLVAPR